MSRNIILLHHHYSNGFTYIMMLIAIVALSLFAGIAVQTTSSISKADKEKELIFRGQAYRSAIASYYRAGRLRKEYPPSLEALIKDPRFPNKHHIRRLYIDPITSTNKWSLIYGEDGGIIGVASTSKKRPKRQQGFPNGLEHFNEASSYSDWHFKWSPKKSINSNTNIISKSQKFEVEH